MSRADYFHTDATFFFSLCFKSAPDLCDSSSPAFNAWLSLVTQLVDEVCAGADVGVCTPLCAACALQAGLCVRCMMRLGCVVGAVRVSLRACVCRVLIPNLNPDPLVVAQVNAAISDHKLNVQFILDGDGVPKDCLVDMWKPWPATYISGDDPSVSRKQQQSRAWLLHCVNSVSTTGLVGLFGGLLGTFSKRFTRTTSALDTTAFLS